MSHTKSYSLIVLVLFISLAFSFSSAFSAAPLAAVAGSDASTSTATQIHLHVVVTANDDGSQAGTMTDSAIASGIQKANQQFLEAGIHFTYTPAADKETKNNTLLNQDVLVPSNVASTGLETSEVQHVIDADDKGHIIERFTGPRDSGWGQKDLTAAASAPLGYEPIGYTSDNGGMQHVVFVGASPNSGKVYELYYEQGITTNWTYQDLSASAGETVPAVYFPSPIVTPDGTEHIFFGGNDNHVHELYGHTGSQWYKNDLNSAVPTAPLIYAISYLRSYITYSGTAFTLHVVYLTPSGANYHVAELFYTPGQSSNWGANDLTQLSGSPDSWGSPHPFTYRWQSDQYIVTHGIDHHIYMIYNLKGEPNWQHADLTSLTGAPLALASPGSIDTYLTDDTIFGWGEIPHVVYNTSIGHIVEIYYSNDLGQWVYKDLSHDAVGAVPGSSYNTAYTTNSRQDQHIVYAGDDNKLYDLHSSGNTIWTVSALADITEPITYGFDPTSYTSGVGDSYSVRAARNRLAVFDHPHDLVIFVSHGTDLQYNSASKLNVWSSNPRTFSFANGVDAFVAMKSGSDGSDLAHNLGHYFHLLNTFGPTPNNVSDAIGMVQQYVNVQGHTFTVGDQVFDGDKASVSDTPPDPGAALWQSVYGNLCSTQNSLVLPVPGLTGAPGPVPFMYALIPLRKNIMSNFDQSCPQLSGLPSFTPNQITRLQAALVIGNRQPLLYWPPIRFIYLPTLKK